VAPAAPARPNRAPIAIQTASPSTIARTRRVVARRIPRQVSRPVLARFPFWCEMPLDQVVDRESAGTASKDE
jgi:hypothetical protein